MKIKHAGAKANIRTTERISKSLLGTLYAVVALLGAPLANGQFLNGQQVTIALVNAAGEHDAKTVVVDSRPGEYEHTFSSFGVDIYDISTNTALIEVHGFRRATFVAEPNKLRVKFPTFQEPAFRNAVLYNVNWPGMDSSRLTVSGSYLDIEFGSLKDDPEYHLAVRIDQPGYDYPRLSIAISKVQVSWDAVPGRRYQLQFLDNLGSGKWTNTGDPITATSTKLSVEQPVTPGSRFFRVMGFP